MKKKVELIDIDVESCVEVVPPDKKEKKKKKKKKKLVYELVKKENLDWDFVLVFRCPMAFYIESIPALKKSKYDERGGIIRRLRMCGLIVKKQMSRDNDELFVKVTASQEVLEETAERIKLVMELNEECGGEYMGYKRDIRHLFKQYDAAKDHVVFSSSQRQMLVLQKIRMKKIEGGGEVDIDFHLLEKNNLVQAFPLHEPAKRKRLMDIWVKKWFAPQPLTEIRDYFGEEVALYFAWLEFYTNWLKYLSFFGIITFIYQLFHGMDSLIVPFYCIFLVLWATLFIEFWKRRQAQLCFEWGLYNMSILERSRPEFKGDLRYGFYSDNGTFVSLEAEAEKHPDKPEAVEQQVYYSKHRRNMKALAGLGVVLLFTVVVVLVTLWVMELRVVLQDHVSPFWGGVLTGNILAIIISVLNFVYGYIAFYLNRWENHRTETDNRNGLIIKTFVFQFINSYMSLFYVAFIKVHGITFFSGEVDKCEQGECIEELTTALGSLMITKQILGLFQEIGIPFLWNKMTMGYEASKMKLLGINAKPMCTVERESKYFTYASTFQDYNEMVIQFGYVTLFAAGFPIASLAALINNLLELRTDAFKLLSYTSRPRKSIVASIGMWQTILEILSIACVITNCGIIAFTSIQLVELNWSTLKILSVAVIAEHILLLLKWLIAIAIPDTPEWVQKEAGRRAYLANRALEEPEAVTKVDYWEEGEGPPSDCCEEDSEIEIVGERKQGRVVPLSDAEIRSLRTHRLGGADLENLEDPDLENSEEEYESPLQPPQEGLESGPYALPRPVTPNKSYYLV
eukprot:GCRY01003309.1.p1 GENE.GCRY01003309.1~~GCRY01003309.1.p1  ORF type:complete len:797 (+),score=257.69 GCRY01003309.1:169-2559(+)